MKKYVVASFVLAFMVSIFLLAGCGNATGGGGGGGGGGTSIYTLGITVTPESWGTVEVSPTGEITAQGTREYASGTVVTVTAEATGGHTFDHWGGDLSSLESNPVTIEMNGNKNITASFQHIYYNLSVSVSPTGGGTVEPYGGTYIDGTDVLLTASAESGYAFSSWEGTVSTTSNPSTVEMTSAKDVTAYFHVAGSVIGDSYQGGIVFYILQSGNPGYITGETHGLIAATSDQSTGIHWYNGSYIATGATATALGTGLSNTNTIISSQGEVATSYAAGLARAYDGGGYHDWFLPSRDELNNLYLNRVAVGGFASMPYWSSSETGAGGAWSQGLGTGYQSASNTSNADRVRAIRAF